MSVLDSIFSSVPKAAAQPDPLVVQKSQMDITINNTHYTIYFDVDGEGKVSQDGRTVAWGVNIQPWMSLNEMIRSVTSLVPPRTKGTKISCAEGGCGACVVMITSPDPNDPTKQLHRSVNSCLRRLALCNGMHVTTTEGIMMKGQKEASTSYNPVQTKLASYGGSQCGFCSPGMVMTQYALLMANPSPTSEEIERALDGNICRCTGYRPILAAFKTFAKDGKKEANVAPSSSKVDKTIFPNLRAIEEHIPEEHKKYITATPMSLPIPVRKSEVRTRFDGQTWMDISSKAALDWQIQNLAKTAPTATYMLANGFTSLGVYRAEASSYQYYLNISDVPELSTIGTTPGGVQIGGCVSIEKTIQALLSAQQTFPDYRTAWYKQIAAHLERVAHNHIRGVASCSGNLMLQYKHQVDNDCFPSDIATLFMGYGVVLDIADAIAGTVQQMNVSDFLASDMTHKYIVSILIPFAAKTTKFQSFKTAIRQVNSHGIVIGAMRAEIDPTTNKASNSIVVFNGVGPKAMRYATVEAALNGTVVTDESAFQKILKVTQDAVATVTPDIQFKAEYRQSLCYSYLYKFFLLLQPSLPDALKSAVDPWMVRPVSTGTQHYQTDPSELPVSEFLPKRDGLKQASGEATYNGDIDQPGPCVHAAFIYADRAKATFIRVDPSVVQNEPGYIRFFGAKDVPNNQSFIFGGPLLLEENTEVPYAGKPLGVVVAQTQYEADHIAAILMKTGVTYSGSTGKPLLTVDDAIAAGSFHKMAPPGSPIVQGDAEKALSTSDHVFKGSWEMGTQYHYYMEPQTVLVEPTEGDDVAVYVSCQGPTMVQQAVAASLKLPEANIDVHCKRCGGGYGGKITNSILPAQAAAVCSAVMNRAVSLRMSTTACMHVLGMRVPWKTYFEVGAQNDGMITGLVLKAYTNCGTSPVDAASPAYLFSVDNCYNIPNWHAETFLCKTDLPPYTACRAPGWCPGIFTMERIISYVAGQLGLSADEVREKNFYKKNDVTPYNQPLSWWNMDTIWEQIQTSAGYADRKKAVAAFNSANKWRKRGLALTPAKFGVYWSGLHFGAQVQVYGDGSVVIVVGGIEMGQGLDTKCAQVCAYKLGCSIDNVKNDVTTTKAIPGPGNISGGSTASEMSCLAVMNACDVLNQVLAPARKAAGDKATWAQVVAQAETMGLNLCARGYTNPPPTTRIQQYQSYCAAVTEVELDVLTGQTELTRVDIVQDVGTSMNPAVDIGQVEGAYMFGVGYCLQEEMVRDTNSGALITDSTWTYKPPSSMDVPLEFNVTLLANAPNPNGVLSSKAVGEPPLTLSIGTILALEDAINASRKELGLGSFHATHIPFTPQDASLALGIPASGMVLK